MTAGRRQPLQPGLLPAWLEAAPPVSDSDSALAADGQGLTASLSSGDAALAAEASGLTATVPAADSAHGAGSDGSAGPPPAGATRVNTVSIGASSSAATAYSATIPSGTGIKAGDLIIVTGDGNGTHVTNGMSVKDSVNNVNFGNLSEVDQTNSSSHWMQTFSYVTPQDIPDGSTITFTPYAASTTNSFSADVFRGTTGLTDAGPANGTAASALSVTTTALSPAPPAGSLVLSLIGVSTGTLSVASPFTLGSSQTSGQSTANGYVLSADGSSTYSVTWTLGTANSNAFTTVAFGTASGPSPGSDTAKGTEASGLTATVPSSDSASAAEASGLTASLSDTALAADSQGLTATVPSSDSAFSAEASGLTAAVPSADAAQGTEASGLAATVPSAEAAFSADGQGLTATVPASDAASAAEASGLAATVPASDSALAAEASGLAATVPASDAASAAETSGLAAHLSDGETAAGADSNGVTPGGSTPVSDADVLHGEDSGFSFVTGAETAAGSETGMLPGPAAGDGDSCLAAEAELRAWPRDGDLALAAEGFSSWPRDGDAGRSGDGAEHVTVPGAAVSDTEAASASDTENESVEVYSFQPPFRWTGGGYELVWRVSDGQGGWAGVTVWRGPVPDAGVYRLHARLMAAGQVVAVSDGDCCRAVPGQAAPRLAVSLAARRALAVTVTVAGVPAWQGGERWHTAMR